MKSRKVRDDWRFDRWRHERWRFRFLGRVRLLEERFGMLQDQRLAQDLVHMMDQFNVDTAQYGGRDIANVLFVLPGNQYRLDAAALRCEDFFLQSADRQDASAQSHFTGHREIVAHRNLRERRD